MHMKILQLCRKGVSILFHLYHLISGRTSAAPFTLIICSFSQDKYAHSIEMFSFRNNKGKFEGTIQGVFVCAHSLLIPYLGNGIRFVVLF